MAFWLMGELSARAVAASLLGCLRVGFRGGRRRDLHHGFRSESCCSPAKKRRCTWAWMCAACAWWCTSRRRCLRTCGLGQRRDRLRRIARAARDAHDLRIGPPHPDSDLGIRRRHRSRDCGHACAHHRAPSGTSRRRDDCHGRRAAVHLSAAAENAHEHVARRRCSAVRRLAMRRRANQRTCA